MFMRNYNNPLFLANSEYLAHGDTVQPVELENLKRVFKWLDTKKDDKICWQELSEALVKLGAKTAKDQIELWIWEVDDDLDHMVGWDEFLTMYQRCISDQTGFEPRNLFNLVQFLMYDKDFHGKISVEQTLQIIYVRHGRKYLDKEIGEIFGEEQKGSDGQELKITFSQFDASFLRGFGGIDVLRLSLFFGNRSVGFFGEGAIRQTYVRSNSGINSFQRHEYSPLLSLDVPEQDL
eukprot:s4394_g4.t2